MAINVKKECQLWKRCLLRFGRVFFFSFFVQFIVFLNGAPEAWTTAIIMSAVMSCIIAGFTALDKYLREKS